MWSCPHFPSQLSRISYPSNKRLSCEPKLNGNPLPPITWPVTPLPAAHCPLPAFSSSPHLNSHKFQTQLPDLPETHPFLVIFITTNRSSSTIRKMAKLVFFLVALLFLFSFSHARTPSSDLPEKETNGRDPANTKLTESEPKPATTILLPSEKRDSEPAKVFEWIPEAADTKLPDSDGPTILANEESTEFTHSEPVQLTVISFRPVNRHFPRRPLPLSFRHGHPCRHGRRHVGPWSPRFHGGERDRDVVSYGDDMILGDDLAFDPVSRGGPRQIPSRWGKFRHGGPRFPFRHDDDMELERLHHHHHHRHHHDHDHDHDREGFEGMEKPREHSHEHEREHEGGLMRRFRKFLNRF